MENWISRTSYSIFSVAIAPLVEKNIVHTDFLVSELVDLALFSLSLIRAAQNFDKADNIEAGTYQAPQTFLGKIFRP